MVGAPGILALPPPGTYNLLREKNIKVIIRRRIQDNTGKMSYSSTWIWVVTGVRAAYGLGDNMLSREGGEGAKPGRTQRICTGGKEAREWACPVR